MEYSLEQRQAVLQNAINNYLAKGYRVVTQTNTAAQLIKPKKPVNLLLLILLWVTVLGGIVYLLIRMSSGGKSVYLQVDPSGNLTETKGKG